MMRTSFSSILATSGVTFTFLISLGASAANVTYTESTADISNPDRGFYFPYTTTSSQFTALRQSELIARRTTAYTPFQANYSVKSSIALRQYVMDSFVNVNELSSAFLSNLQVDFDAARAAGVRLIIRFSYNNTPLAGDCVAGFICPPYGDAPKARVISHINQLASVLTQNSDVILGVQQGFIGTWGENYYTDHFGDASVNADQGYLTNENWNDRNEVVRALLAAVPPNRMVQVRYPQAKQRFIFGATAPLNSPPLSAEQAFNQSDAARIGVHNDCFLASDDDFGTFADYGNDDSPVSMSNSLRLKDYAKDDGAYTLVGGETCSDQSYNPQNNCASQAGGMAVADMQSYHYSYLNSDYNNAVNNDWQEGACIDEIKRRLGYRLVLERAELPDTGVVNETASLSFTIKNTGFAAAVNPRQLWLVLRHKETQVEYKRLLAGPNTNPQAWLSGRSYRVQASTVLSGVAAGNYSMWLHIADPSDNGRISARPEYSIQLANVGTWDAASGYNDLQATMMISQSVDESSVLDFLPAILGSGGAAKSAD